jgi:hypothetical protein
MFDAKAALHDKQSCRNSVPVARSPSEQAVAVPDLRNKLEASTRKLQADVVDIDGGRERRGKGSAARDDRRLPRAARHRRADGKAPVAVRPAAPVRAHTASVEASDEASNGNDHP